MRWKNRGVGAGDVGAQGPRRVIMFAGPHLRALHERADHHPLPPVVGVHDVAPDLSARGSASMGMTPRTYMKPMTRPFCPWATKRAATVGVCARRRRQRALRAYRGYPATLGAERSPVRQVCL